MWRNTPNAWSARKRRIAITASATSSATSSATMSPLWRRAATTLVALSLSAVLILGLAGATSAQSHATSTPSAQPKVYQPSGHSTALAHGVVDMAKLPILQPHAVTSVQASPLPSPDALTPAQRQAYNTNAHKAVPTAVPGAQTKSPTSAAGPSFVGGGLNPLLVKQFDGINSTAAGNGTGNAAIATDLSYLMEGVDNAIAIYSAASGAKLYGPYAPASFFAPVYHSGDLFAYPQMYYDTMRDHWVVVYLEIAPNRVVTYLDVAVSQTTSPTQPTLAHSTTSISSARISSRATLRPATVIMRPSVWIIGASTSPVSSTVTPSSSATPSSPSTKGQC